MSGNPLITRRNLLNTAGALTGIGAAAGLARGFGLFRRHWPRSAYDDLLGRLALRDEAVTLGRAVLAAWPKFSAHAAASRLRTGFREHGSLSALAVADAMAKRTTEVAGWVLPHSVAELSALAATSAGISPRSEFPK